MSNALGWFARPDAPAPKGDPAEDADETAFEALDLPAHVQEFLAQKAAAGV